MNHQIVRARHELRVRKLVVGHSEFVTPNLVRLTLVGDALVGFTSPSPDDHIKVFAGVKVQARAVITSC